MPDYIPPSGPLTRRQEVFAGVTDASGNFSGTFAVAFATSPHLNPEMIPAVGTNRSIFITAISTTGFTVKVVQRATLTVLALEVLAGTPTNVVGAPVSVCATANEAS